MSSTHTIVSTTVRPATWLVAASLAAIYVIWGTTYFALKVGVTEISPFFLIGTRFLVAGGVLLGFLLLRGYALPTLRQWGGASVLGFLLLVVGLGTVTIAEKSVSSGFAVALISILPLITALWSGAFGKWPRGWEWGAIGLGSLGTLVMITGQDMQASPMGTVLILIGAVAWSFGTVISNKLDVPHGPMGFAAEMVAGGVLALLVSLVFGETWTLPTTDVVWGAWAYLVVFGSLIAFSAYRFLADRVSPTLAATYAYVNPPVALLVGWWLGGETFSANVFIGLPIVLIAVGLHMWVQMRVTAAATSSTSSPEKAPAPSFSSGFRAPRASCRQA